jgi:hypothetical protein
MSYRHFLPVFCAEFCCRDNCGALAGWFDELDGLAVCRVFEF